LALWLELRLTEGLAGTCFGPAAELVQLPVSMDSDSYIAGLMLHLFVHKTCAQVEFNKSSHHSRGNSLEQHWHMIGWLPQTSAGCHRALLTATLLRSMKKTNL
jgi:hypothetical protein